MAMLMLTMLHLTAGAAYLPGVAAQEEELQTYGYSGSDMSNFSTVQFDALTERFYSESSVALYSLIVDIDPTTGYGMSSMSVPAGPCIARLRLHLHLSELQQFCLCHV